MDIDFVLPLRYDAATETIVDAKNRPLTLTPANAQRVVMSINEFDALLDLAKCMYDGTEVQLSHLVQTLERCGIQINPGSALQALNANLEDILGQ